MKRLLIILIILSSCSMEQQDECDCIRRTYNRVSEQVPNTTTCVVKQVHILTEIVPCQEEKKGVRLQLQGYSDPYFDVECVGN